MAKELYLFIWWCIISTILLSGSVYLLFICKDKDALDVWIPVAAITLVSLFCTFLYFVE